MLIPESLSLVVAIGAGVLVFLLPLAILYAVDKIIPGKLLQKLVAPLSVFMLIMPLPVAYFFYTGGKTVLVIEDADGMTRTDWLAYGNPAYRFKDGSARPVGGPSFFYGGSTVINDTERSLVLVEMTYYTKGTPESSNPTRIRDKLPPRSVTSVDHLIRFFGWGPDGPDKSVPSGTHAGSVLVYWLTWPRDTNRES